MGLADIEFNEVLGGVRSLEEWERRLSIPAKTLIHFGIEGQFQLLVRQPPIPHLTFAITPGDTEGSASGLVRDPYLNRVSPAPNLEIGRDWIIGFVANKEAYAELAKTHSTTLAHFDRVRCRSITWDKWNGLVPTSGTSEFCPSDCYIGVFHENTEAAIQHFSINPHRYPHAPSSVGEDRVPFTLKVRPDDILISDVDIKRFVASFRSHAFISDLFVGGKITRDLPGYVSGKLAEIIEANRVLWGNFEESESSVYNRTRQATVDFLDEDFRNLCDKKTNSDKLIETAAAFCDPSLVPKSRRIHSPAVTPQILALLTAAKLYWSSRFIDNEVLDTQPERETVEGFLKFIGLTEGKTASVGTTIIRPENANSHSRKKSEHPVPFFHKYVRPSTRRP